MIQVLSKATSKDKRKSVHFIGYSKTAALAAFSFRSVNVLRALLFCGRTI